MQNDQPQQDPVTIKSFADFLGQMSPANGMDFVLYRGQACQNWPLLPKLARPDYCEPGRWTMVKEVEMLDNFKDHAIGILGPSVRSYNDWELLALAQHFGMATKYLDWTRNPLVALWFCVAGPICGAKNGAVWKLERKKVPTNPRGKLFKGRQGTFTFYEPAHVTTRMRVQAAVFTVHYSNPDHKENFVPLERATAKAKFDALTKYIIPHTKFYDFRKELNRLGVNALSLFPDLEHTCEHINWFANLPRPKRDSIKSYDSATEFRI